MASATGKHRLVVYAAIAANLLVALAKFAAAVITGSSAMTAEGIHSVVDTANDSLLLLGQKKSQKPPDDAHPFGHGKELYFWSLIVAIVIFGIGGGMSVLEGLYRLFHPEPLSDPIWSYAALALAACAEGASWVIALREFRRTMRQGESPWHTFRHSKDPTDYSVLFEDSAALAGVLVAFFGVLLNQLFGWSWADASASILIGVLLATVAIFLVIESKGLLIGESIDPEDAAALRALVEDDPAVRSAGRPLTMHLGPQQVLVNIAIRFARQLDSAELESAIARIERRIQDAYPAVTQIFLEADSLRDGTN